MYMQDMGAHFNIYNKHFYIYTHWTQYSERIDSKIKQLRAGYLKIIFLE